jgi:hypothetical protein
MMTSKLKGSFFACGLSVAVSVAALLAASPSLAQDASVSVSGGARPWSVIANPSLYYGLDSDWGVFDPTPAPAGDGGTEPQGSPTTIVDLTPGATSVTVAFQSSSASLYGIGAQVPSYIDYGSGTPGSYSEGGAMGGPNGWIPWAIDQGTSGNIRLPSYYFGLDSSPNAGYGALIASFADSNGVVISSFAPGDSPDTLAVPVGATELLLGLNDGNNTIQGSMMVDVSQSSGVGGLGSGAGGGVPEASTWVMMLLGAAGLGAAMARRARA